MYKMLKKNDGYMTIEITLVFSVCFFAILLIMYIGMVLFQQVNHSSLAQRAASRGSIIYVTRTTNMHTGQRTLEDFKDRDPYRYIFDSKLKDTESIVNSYVSDNVGASSIIAGKNKNAGKFVKIENDIITKRVVVSIKKDYRMPIDVITNMFGIDSVFSVNAEGVAPVSDPVEFIRNTDMCVDIIRHTETGAAVNEKLAKIKNKVEEMQNILKTE